MTHGPNREPAICPAPPRALTAAEIGRAFDLVRLLNHGYLPGLYEADRPDRLLASYVGDYLKEEVAAEGLVRSLPVFSAFLILPVSAFTGELGALLSG